MLNVITASRPPGRSPASRSTVAARRALSANSRYVHRRSPWTTASFSPAERTALSSRALRCITFP
ncbi:hypothetical protein WQ59_17105 [Streptomyces sp. KE1]|nr:hypothetical protein WQ59_17105 [Streptomyces sp. KE1]